VDLSERQGTSDARHPWEQARARFFDRLTNSIIRPEQPVEWLDVGAGDAWLGMQIADSLPAGSSMICWDVNYSADDIETLTLDAPGVVFTAERPTGHADVISLLDVLEHVEDDVGLLRPLVEQHLAADGVVIVSVPAYQGLFTAHDTALAHHRRYSPRQCRAVLQACGLRVDEQGGLFSTLLAPRAAQKALERFRTPGDQTGEQAGVGGWNGGSMLTRSMTFVLNADAAASRWVSRHGHVLPGLSYWAVCRHAA
jgi:Methyltransferase domain